MIAAGPSLAPYSPECVEKLFGKGPKVSWPSAFGAGKWLIEAPKCLLGVPQSPDPTGRFAFPNSFGRSILRSSG